MQRESEEQVRFRQLEKERAIALAASRAHELLIEAGARRQQIDGDKHDLREGLARKTLMQTARQLKGQREKEVAFIRAHRLRRLQREQRVAAQVAELEAAKLEAREEREKADRLRDEVITIFIYYA